MPSLFNKKLFVFLSLLIAFSMHITGCGGKTTEDNSVSDKTDTTIKASSHRNRTPAPITISVSSKSVNESVINGMWTTVSVENNVVSTGFTPFSYSAVAGKTYTVTVSDYQNILFNHWENGNSNRSITIVPTQNISLLAYYSTAPPPPPPQAVTLNINSRSIDEEAISGLWTTVSMSGQILATGYTPLAFNGIAGNTYVITASDYQDLIFNHWQDESQDRSLVVTPSDNMNLIAYYSTSPLEPPPPPPPPPPQPANIIISTLALDDSAISGLWATVKLGDEVLATGYTPFTFNGIEGSAYTITIDDSESYLFDHWKDGSEENSINVTPTESMTLVAYCSAVPSEPPPPVPVPANLTISSLALDGSNISGMWTTINSQGQTLISGFTPLSFSGIVGDTYTITVSDYQNIIFDHWEGGSQTASITVTPYESMTLVAFYNTSSPVEPPPPPPPPVESPVTLIVSSLYSDGQTLNGMWTTISLAGQLLTSGFTPLTFSGIIGNTYEISVGDYQNIIFDHWEDGSTVRNASITPSQNMTLTAYYNDETSSEPPPPPSSSADAGVMVPLYIYPGSAWNPVIQAKTAHPNVQIIAIVNPADGPGSGIDSNYTAWIRNLKTAGVVVLGYVPTTYGARSLGDCEADVNRWKSYYDVAGIFFDEMSNVRGYENYYSTLNNYSKSLGMTFTVGNPGVDTRSSFIGTVDNIVIYESPGMPSSSALAGWHTSYDPANFSILPFGVGELNASSVTTASQYVKYIYVTNDVLPNPWDSLPPYFSSLVSLLDQ